MSKLVDNAYLWWKNRISIFWIPYFPVLPRQACLSGVQDSPLSDLPITLRVLQSHLPLPKDKLDTLRDWGTSTAPRHNPVFLGQVAESRAANVSYFATVVVTAQPRPLFKQDQNSLLFFPFFCVHTFSLFLKVGSNPQPRLSLHEKDIFARTSFFLCSHLAFQEHFNVCFTHCSCCRSIFLRIRLYLHMHTCAPVK